MATGVIRSAIASVVDKTPSQSTRSVKLDKACQGERVIEYLDSFCTGLLKHFQDMVKATAGKYQSHSAQRTYLWSIFHRLRVNKDLKIVYALDIKFWVRWCSCIMWRMLLPYYLLFLIYILFLKTNG